MLQLYKVGVRLWRQWLGEPLPEAWPAALTARCWTGKLVAQSVVALEREARQHVQLEALLLASAAEETFLQKREGPWSLALSLGLELHQRCPAEGEMRMHQKVRMASVPALQLDTAPDQVRWEHGSRPALLAEILLAPALPLPTRLALAYFGRGLHLVLLADTWPTAEEPHPMVLELAFRRQGRQLKLAGRNLWKLERRQSMEPVLGQAPAEMSALAEALALETSAPEMSALAQAPAHLGHGESWELATAWPIAPDLVHEVPRK